MTRMLVVVGAVVAAVVLFIVLRPDGDSGTTATTATTTQQEQPPPSTETETEAEAEPPPPPPPPPAVTTIAVTLREGAPVGGIRRATVKSGRRVLIVVRSDVSDEIHVHGYDVSRDVAPGEPARIRFTADVPGRFEVELEDRGVQLIDLRVGP